MKQKVKTYFGLQFKAEKVKYRKVGLPPSKQKKKKQKLNKFHLAEP